MVIVRSATHDVIILSRILIALWHSNTVSPTVDKGGGGGVGGGGSKMWRIWSRYEASLLHI